MNPPNFDLQRWAQLPELVTSFMFCKSDRLAHWQASAVLMCELFEAAFGLSEERIARIKLDWWLQESDRTLAGAPTHPLTVTLVELGQADYAALPEAIAALIDGLDAATPVDSAAQHALHCKWSAPMTSWLLGPNVHAAIIKANSAAITRWSQLWQLRYALKPARYGPGVVPLMLAAQFQLPTRQLTNPAPVNMQSAVRALLRQPQSLTHISAPELAALNSTVLAINKRAATRWNDAQHAQLLGEHFSREPLFWRFGSIFAAWNAARICS
jgi:hypothetical protein